MCKVAGCKQNHDKHFCKACKTPDVDHFSHACPHLRKYYYGTSIAIAKKIKDNGFKTTKKGTDHEGVYFSKHMEGAVRHARKKFNEKEYVVLECQVLDKQVSEYSPPDNNPPPPPVTPPDPNLLLNCTNGLPGDKPNNGTGTSFVRNPLVIKVTTSYKIKQ